MTTEQMMDNMQAYADKEHAAIAETVTHPIHEYTDERVQRLLAAADVNRRYTWPADLRVNV
jgi:predicted NAD/FAD-binding protein